MLRAILIFVSALALLFTLTIFITNPKPELAGSVLTALHAFLRNFRKE